MRNLDLHVRDKLGCYVVGGLLYSLKLELYCNLYLKFYSLERQGCGATSLGASC